MRTLRDIKFPVFPLPKEGKITKEDNMLVYTTKTGSEYVIDDLNLRGSFIHRRLMCEHTLLPLKKAVITIGNFILISRIYNTFIDATGKLFNYKKVVFAPLVVKKILQRIPYNSGCVLIIENLHCPIMYYRPVSTSEKYLILTIWGHGYIPLALSETDYLRRTKIKI